MAVSTQTWTFFSNHAHVLICIAEAPDARMRDIALRIGLTERAVQKAIDDLAQAGYLEIIREGRRNRYRLIPHQHLRHPVERHVEIDDVIQLVLSRRGSPTPENPSERSSTPPETSRG